jgi:hypothetical protein
MNRIVVSALLLFFPLSLFCQGEADPPLVSPQPDSIRYDTLHIPKGVLIFGPDFFIEVPGDTVLLVKSYTLSKGEMQSIASTKTFYDSAYVKFGRHKISRFLYTLLFVPPRVYTLPDTSQIIRSEVPYVRYKGKIIRHIDIKTLAPFGPTVADTCAQTTNWVGKTGNKTHLTTREHVIRKNLLFKQGQKADPILLADNERLLRDMPAIGDVRIIVSPTPSDDDSVDITVITKDVFSIGFDFLMVTPAKSVFRLYDGNFLGLGDRLTNEFSIESSRGPYIREDGISYNLTNIGGTFIDGIANYFHDDIGNQNVSFQFRRSFFSNRTRWAGSGLFQYSRYKDHVNDNYKITSYYYDANLWIGRAFFLRTKDEPVRLIISQAAYNRHYYSRPFISPDSNKRYYNYVQWFTGFSISKNNYYLTDYILEFGKTENIPYGHLFELTFGPEFSDYYTRFYSGIEIAYGDFIKKFGYLSGDINFGGFFRGNSYEDAVLKIQARYMTYLFSTRSKRYKFRIYLVTDYKSGFNFRINNRDYYAFNSDLQLNKTTDPASLEGRGAISASLSTVFYTPWYFYGFKFALLEQIQGGFITNKNAALFATQFYPGIRTGLIIKNDNLIFPALVISLFYYPNTPSGGSSLQFLMNISTGIKFPDYNVSAPKEESLQN